MEILWLILKIIGIVLLSIVGLLLFVVLVLLITPFRYRIQGKYQEKTPDVLARFYFWLHLVSVNATYRDGTLAVVLRILFFKKTFLEKQIPAKKDETDNVTSEDILQLEEDTEETVEAEETDAQPEENQPKETSPETEESAAEEETSEADKPEESEAEAPSETEETEEAIETKKKLTLWQKIQEKAKSLWQKACDLKKKTVRRKKAVEWLLDQPATGKLLIRVKLQVIKLLKSILPKKLKGHVTIGLADPSTMGMICRYAGLFYPSLPKNFEFNPVFDEEIIDVDVDVKGRIILGALLAHVLRLVVSPNLWKTLRNLKRFKKKWR